MRQNVGVSEGAGSGQQTGLHGQDPRDPRRRGLQRSRREWEEFFFKKVVGMALVLAI